MIRQTRSGRPFGPWTHFLLALVLTGGGRAYGEEELAGWWDTNHGRLYLKVDGRKVSGVCLEENALRAVRGSTGEDGITLEGPRRAASNGERLELDNEKGTLTGGGWEGRRVVPGDDPQRSFDGVWQMGWNDGTLAPMRLLHREDRLTGTYDQNGAAFINGSASGERAEFSYKEPEASGEGWYELAPDGRSFYGEWRVAGAGSWSHWAGTRVTPDPKRSWLVVLEAPWESGLSEPEYNFGEMLQAFFTRTPQVQVRQRFFHDQPDLDRWLREVVFLAEPTIVLLSTHGTGEGLVAKDGVVGPDALSKSLSYAGSVRLLHIDGCSVMGGEFPRRLMAGLDRGHRFPVSGYSRVIDWAASAIVDFLYLDLILERGLAPTAAVEQVKRMMPLAAAEDVAGAALSSTGLAIQPSEAAPAAPTSNRAAPRE